MESWQEAIGRSITRPEEILERFPIEIQSVRAVVERYPMRITRYYFGLIKEPGDPIWRQCVPDIRELQSDSFDTDPLCEKRATPVPGLVHRYPDRVLLLTTSMCPTFCRFCLRKHDIGSNYWANSARLEIWAEYIEKREEVREVILSGGDPLVLSDEILDAILGRLRAIRSVAIIRIHTRAVVTLPERITNRLCQILKRYHPLYVICHFNHPAEITSESAEACAMLANAGIPLGNQTVLLRGINDEPEVMKNLMQKLLAIRVRPYYIHHPDPVKGTAHFWTNISKGMEIMEALQGKTSGLAVPYYVIEVPGGMGKVPVLPRDVRISGNRLIVRGYKGEMVEYHVIDLEETINPPV